MPGSSSPSSYCMSSPHHTYFFSWLSDKTDIWQCFLFSSTLKPLHFWQQLCANCFCLNRWIKEFSFLFGEDPIRVNNSFYFSINMDTILVFRPNNKAEQQRENRECCMSGRQINTSNQITLSGLELTAWLLPWLTRCIDFLYSWFLWKHVNRYEAQLTAELLAWAHLSYTGVKALSTMPSSAVWSKAQFHYLRGYTGNAWQSSLLFLTFAFCFSLTAALHL